MKMSFPTKLRIARDLILLPFRLLISGGGTLIYLPRRYSEIPEYADWIDSVERIDFQSRGHSQTAFLDADPTANSKRIWFLFGGNGALALDWLPIVSFAPESPDAFVMVEYPGYGFSSGKPSPDSIRESVDDLIAVLRVRFGMSEAEFVSRLGVMGHSLGAAVAMETASRYGAEEVILISPFTSMKALAEKTVGRFPTRFLRHHFDNVAAMENWVSKVNRSKRIRIFHGTADELIPLSMAEEMAEKFQDRIQLHAIPDGDHNGIVLQLREKLLSLLVSPSGSKM